MEPALVADDGVTLEAQWAPAPSPRATVVLCHPHPLHGGTMQSLVTGALFESLPSAGISCLRFNFRGVGASGGTHDDGIAEQLDARAALAFLDDTLDEHLAVVMSGWSFGADIALSITDDRIAGWLAIAVPLRWGDQAVTAADSRPKCLILAEHDEFQPASIVEEQVASWTNTQVDIVPGASHFFVGRTDRVTELTLAFTDALAISHTTE